MSTLLYGYASCTGVSILFVDALRTIGIPARVVGTPAWHGDHAQGNHNWVEVFVGDPRGEPWADPDTGQSWAFIEALPAGVSVAALPLRLLSLKESGCAGWGDLHESV